MKLIEFSDTHLGFNDVNTLQNTNNHLYTSNFLTYLKTILLTYDLLFFMAILKIFYEVFGSQYENRCMKILEAFYITKAVKVDMFDKS